MKQPSDHMSFDQLILRDCQAKYKKMMDEIAEDGLIPFGPDSNSTAVWNDIIPTPMGIFMLREDAYDFASSIPSALLLLAALHMPHFESREPTHIADVQDWSAEIMAHLETRRPKRSRHEPPWADAAT
jgi:hypothetical protein